MKFSPLTVHINNVSRLLKTFPLIFSLFVLSPIFGQSDTLPKKNPILIKWTPSALVGYSSLQFAAELNYHERRSIQLEYGLIFPEISIYNANDRGHKVRLEHRFYFNKKRTWYLAPELNFIYVRYDTQKRFSDNWETDSLGENTHPIDSYYETIGMRKTIATVNCKIGFQYVFAKPKIVIDLYAGIGVRYVNTMFTSYPTKGEYVSPIDYFLEPPFTEGNRWTPNAIVGVKVGYQF